MKRLITRTLLVASLALGLVLTAVAAKSDADIMVHITRTGHKYHVAGCRYLRQSDYIVTLKEAKSRGLGACSVCDPPR
jgi:hypothetical protein